MLFLWLVGCNLEERWGAFIFSFVYLAGGAAAALAQSAMHPSPSVLMVGASGSVAAVMGAFLIRHAFIKIRIFYFYMMLITPRWGILEVPAWCAVPLWLTQQLFMGLMTVKSMPSVGYWAHIGGCAFGIVTGVIISVTGIARHWEEQAEHTVSALDEKQEKARAALESGELAAAERQYSAIVAADPSRISAWVALAKVRDGSDDSAGFFQACAGAFRNAALSGNYTACQLLIERAAVRVAAGELPDDKTSMLFATASEQVQQWEKAVQFYRCMIDKYQTSQMYPKALFCCGRVLLQHLGRDEEAYRCFLPLTASPHAANWAAEVAPLVENIACKMKTKQI
jgi:tetratricopeptide (TPR) repeat protein